MICMYKWLENECRWRLKYLLRVAEFLIYILPLGEGNPWLLTASQALSDNSCLFGDIPPVIKS